jgi:hypothetical protein
MKNEGKYLALRSGTFTQGVIGLYGASPKGNVVVHVLGDQVLGSLIFVGAN